MVDDKDQGQGHLDDLLVNRLRTIRGRLIDPLENPAVSIEMLRIAVLNLDLKIPDVPTAPAPRATVE
ncbi:MAG: hypothetical protein ACE5FA_00245 [Dehalococcoidia bacterium]